MRVIVILLHVKTNVYFWYALRTTLNAVSLSIISLLIKFVIGGARNEIHICAST